MCTECFCTGCRSWSQDIRITHNSEALAGQAGFHLIGPFRVKDQDRQAGIPVEGQVNVINVNIALRKCQQQMMEISYLSLIHI